MISAPIRKLIRQMASEGLDAKAIAKKVGISHTAAWWIANNLHQGDKPRALKAVPRPKQGTLLRNCLKCSQEFTAKGRYNRICNRCKDTDQWQAGINWPVIKE